MEGNSLNSFGGNSSFNPYKPCSKDSLNFVPNFNLHQESQSNIGARNVQVQNQSALQSVNRTELEPKAKPNPDSDPKLLDEGIKGKNRYIAVEEKKIEKNIHENFEEKDSEYLRGRQGWEKYEEEKVPKALEKDGDKADLNVCYIQDAFQGKKKDESERNFISQPNVSNTVILKHGQKNLYPEEGTNIREEKRSHGQNYSEDYTILQEQGKGGQGSVFKVRTRKGEIKTMKRYRKDQVLIFIREVIIMTFLNRVYSRGVGICGIIEERDYWCIMMASGVGTLADFKNFIIDEKIKLMERELIRILDGLFWKCNDMKKISLCHRDIKPQNIILHVDELTPEIIDFGLAIFVKSGEHISHKCGTLGYIAPHIMRNNIYSKEDLESNDLFAIGVSMLEIAMSSFTPRKSNKSNMEEIKKAINKLKETMPRLAKCLEVLIFNEGDKFKEYKKISKDLYPKSYNRNGPMEDMLLSGFSNDFQQYMSKKFSNRTCQSEEQAKQTQKLISHISRSWKVDQVANANFDYKNCVNRIINHLENTDFKRALDCYESLVRAYTFEGEKGFFLDDTLENPLVKEVLPLDALTYSIIGIYQSYILRIDEAEQSFVEGLNIAKDKLSKIILLHNLGCLGYCGSFFMDENKSKKLISNLKEAYNLIADMSPEVFCVLTRWMEVESITSGERSSTILSLGDENKDERTVVLLLVAELINFGYIFQQNKKEQIERLLLVVFTNFCCYTAISLIKEIQEKDEDFMAKLKNFVYEFYQQKRLIVKLPPYLKVFQHLIKFCKIFLNEDCSKFKTFKLGKLHKQAKVLYEKKDYLYKIFEKRDSKAIFQELKRCDLFWVMIGCTYKLVDKTWIQTWSTKQILFDKLSVMSEVTTSADLIIRVKEPNEINLFDSLEHYQSSENFEKHSSNTIVLESIPKFTDDRIKKIEMPGSLDVKDNSPKVRDIFESLRSIIDNNDDNTLLLLEDSLQFISILGIRVPLVPSREKKQTQQCSLSYMELQKIRKSWHHPKKSLACLKMLSEDSAFVQIIPRWEPEFETLNTQLQSQPLLKLELVFQGIGDEQEKQVEHLSSIISPLKSLQQIKIIVETSFVNTNGIKYLGEAMKGLEKLEALNLTFKCCPSLTKEGVLLLGDIIAEFAKLRYLSLKFFGCVNVTKEGINELNSQKLAHLQPIKLILDNSIGEQ